ncbi:MAG: DUF4215 domain-containing protein [Deltaproteobacteria bacterium]|nr:DUF4215 domain-containing protein [Deltaproteobacteria bacterium]
MSIYRKQPNFGSKIIKQRASSGELITWACLLGYLATPHVAHATPGNLDPTFGTAGVVTTPVGNTSASAWGLAVDPGGNLLVAGNIDGNFSVVRYLPNGAVDSGFGASGVAVATIGSGSALAEDVVVTAGGTIVAGGYATVASSHALALAGFLSNGSPDTSFGSGGTVLTDPYPSSDDEGQALLLDAQGRLLFGGYTYSSGNSLLARYSSSGSLDTSFGSSGIASGPLHQIESAVLQGDGKIVGTGYWYGSSFSVARWTASGAADSSFGSGGSVQTSIGSRYSWSSAIALSGTKIIAAGGAETNCQNVCDDWGCSFRCDDAFAAAQYDQNGALDPSFGNSGTLLTTIGAFAGAGAVVVQPDGKMVLAGTANGLVALARYTANGQLDTSFGSAGIVTTSIGTNLSLAAASLQNGKLVVAGNANVGGRQVTYLARYNLGCGDGALDPGESCDDGNVTNNDGCSNACSTESGWACPTPGSPCTPICGDSLVKGSEQCDDGGTASGDGCSSTCQVETGYSCPPAGGSCSAICGDGLVRFPESCDDLNTTSNDGCSSTCHIEAGYSCPTPGSACVPVCGDGLIKGSEQCDDGDTANGNGCSSSCTIEAGYTCAGQPSNCSVCGDGTLGGTEQCDDHNNANNDCCSASCQFESTTPGCITVLSVTKNVANTADQGGAGAGGGTLELRSRLSIVSSNGRSLQTRYAAALANNSISFTPFTLSLHADYTVQFSVLVPLGVPYTVTVASSLGGDINIVSDASGSASGSFGAITGTQSGGTLSGSLGLASTSSASNSSSPGSNAFTTISRSGNATITGVGTGSAVTHTLTYSWNESCTSTPAGFLTFGDECGVRLGIGSTISSFTAGLYPGSPMRTASADGHFVSVSLAVCGNGIVDTDTGEQCDQGAANGTNASCCSSSCTYLSSSTVCRAAAGDCDLAEFCTGSSTGCPADAVRSSLTVCRASAGVCDIAENCTGSSVNCPADQVLPAGAICRPAVGACDVAESCTGSSTSCPGDALAPSTSVCRPSLGSCDLAENCTGSSSGCPADSLKGNGTPCTSDGNVCTDDTCNGTSPTCQHTNNTASCNDGDGCPADTCSGGICQPVSCPSVDAVVLPGKPLSVNIGSGKTSVSKTLSITVRNADSVDRIIALAVDGSGCPIGVAGVPDFIPSTPLADTSILVPAGKTKKARLPLTINSSDFDSFNFKAPTRCTLQIIAAAVVGGGSNDPMPDNNIAVVELNVVDKNEVEETTTHETLIKSAMPTSLNIGSGKASAVKTLKAAVVNADYKPTAESPGDPITLSASTTCAGLSLGTPICDSASSSPTVTVKGGASKTCKLTATADGAQISTTNQKSPQRCTVTLTATGPTNPQVTPLDGSNNATELVIDVLDKND